MDSSTASRNRRWSPREYAKPQPVTANRAPTASSGRPRDIASSGAPHNAIRGATSRSLVDGRASRPTARLPESIPTGTHASRKPVVPAGKPRSAAYGMTSASAPVTNIAGNHCANNRRRIDRSLSSRRFPCQLCRNTDPVAGAGAAERGQSYVDNQAGDQVAASANQQCVRAARGRRPRCRRCRVRPVVRPSPSCCSVSGKARTCHRSVRRR